MGSGAQRSSAVMLCVEMKVGSEVMSEDMDYSRCQG